MTQFCSHQDCAVQHLTLSAQQRKELTFSGGGLFRTFQGFTPKIWYSFKNDSHLKKKNVTENKEKKQTIEAEVIKEKWQEYPELYKRDLRDPDNYDSMITHLEPDILECKVKWALGSITTNKASGGDGISVELLQILKDDAVKVLHSICQQIW